MTQDTRLDYRVQIPADIAEKLANYQDPPPDMLDILTLQVVGCEDLTGEGADFGSGSVSGYLSFYDTRDPLPRPLSVGSLTGYVLEVLANSEHSHPFKVGYLVGWIGAWCENKPENVWESVLLPGA